ncbi:hypothetical protein [Novosphingobium album (ex Liu et al. 2023)]|uniref:DUF2384 domain-containing protein n=1 Tax=Novosphingobium album (ex Liu et al. 2023) TaxID=3031130 RepID=A0ABT5WT15_9SPHN|nr:hypothetical protein [Novosphingobium album (ex Liu et al. 2023)]MDE8652994.1 hypothetical protein [Novosphingobium album (ex Liu et al. 2023)]
MSRLRSRFAAPHRLPREIPRPSASLRRRGEVSQLAFLLLGGHAAAGRFLNGLHLGLRETPLAIAMSSPLGQIEVTRILRRLAAGQPGDQDL